MRTTSTRGAESGLRRALPLRPVSVAVLVVLALLTVIGAVATAAVVHDQERRLLDERAAEVDAIFTSEVGQVAPSLASIGDVVTRVGTTEAFDRIAAAEAAGAGPTVTFAWLRPGPGGFTVLAAVGRGLRAGQAVAGSRVATLTEALRGGALLPTPIVPVGGSRVVGFATGPPVAMPDTVLYREVDIGPIRAVSRGGQAFSDLSVVLYASPTPKVDQVAFETTASVPLRGSVATQRIAAGDASWLLQISALHPLVGSVAASAEWGVLAAGFVVIVLTVSAIEIESRRREAAQALYAGEHDMAESLQRSLLPELPVVTGLDVAARYLAGGAGQQVGGDWFDVFNLVGGRTGIVIGDVMGHDLVAAASMSQIRAALRAFAWEGHEPAVVVGQLDRLGETFGRTQLVTLFYGVLQPAGSDHRRVLRYANAGHLPPLVRRPDGAVEALDAASSVVLGAQPDSARGQAEVALEPGAQLVCFTDGLVEAPGGSLEVALAELASSLGGPAVSADDLCARLVDERRPGQRDDIAVLVVGLGLGEPGERTAPIPAGSRVASGPPVA